jgi:hypothetical protein
MTAQESEGSALACLPHVSERHADTHRDLTFKLERDSGASTIFATGGLIDLALEVGAGRGTLIVFMTDTVSFLVTQSSEVRYCCSGATTRASSSAGGYSAHHLISTWARGLG